MNAFSHFDKVISRLFQRAESQHDIGLQKCSWSISSRLAAAPDSLLEATPIDVVTLIREAKLLHPEVASAARRRELNEHAMQEVNARPTSIELLSNSGWVSHAYPLQQVTIRLQGTRHSDKASVVAQLETVLARLKAGDTSGQEHDDDFGYSFEYAEAVPGPSFFDEPSGFL